MFLADDNLIVREGVRALIGFEPDLEVVGVAGDYETLIQGCDELEPNVLVTDIRMPPTFQAEGIEGAKEVRRRHPATGIVVLSQYDDPEYAVSLLAEGSDGYAYLLKDRIAEGDQLVQAIRAVAAGSSVLDPKIVEALVAPVSGSDDLDEREERLLALVAEGRPHKRIAAALGTTPEGIASEIDKLFFKIAQKASTGAESALRRLQSLHAAIVRRDEIGETIEHLLPAGLADKVRAEGWNIGKTERLVVTVLMSDVRGYSAIAERTDPGLLAQQLNEHRALLNEAILASGGTVMQYTGDGVMAVFGAPIPIDDQADRALDASIDIHVRQRELDEEWRARGLPPFPVGIGLCTGEVAAALLGTEARLEYSLVGDTVNLSARLQDLARPANMIIMSESTFEALRRPPEAVERLEPTLVKGRETPVTGYRIDVTELWDLQGRATR